MLADGQHFEFANTSGVSEFYGSSYGWHVAILEAHPEESRIPVSKIPDRRGIRNGGAQRLFDEDGFARCHHVHQHAAVRHVGCGNDVDVTAIGGE